MQMLHSAVCAGASPLFPEITEDMVARYDVPAPRYTSYPTVPEWSDAFGPDDYAACLTQAGAAGAQSPLSLYVHIPFCQEMCTYCGCNVVIARDRGKADPYLDHLEREIALAANRLGERRQCSQLHLGGGTPTFLDEAQILRLWQALGRFSFSADAELAVEVDPVVTTHDQITLLRQLGFNRLSMGVQDFDPEVQRAVHRVQTVEQTGALIEHARALGFRGINVDLIYGLPLQRTEGWARTLGRVLDLAPDRIAVYSFAYVPDVRPHQRRIAPASLPRGAEKLDLFRMAYESFVAAGYQPIGMDHFALPSDELALAQRRRTLSRNFQGYTVKSAADAVAFGVTGISDVAGAYAQSTRPIPRYYQAIDAGRFATERGLRLSEDDRRRRAVITQIMCNFWVNLGKGGATAFARELEDLRALEDEGLLRIDGNEIELSALGRIFVRNVAMVFDSYLRNPAKPAAFSRTV